MLTGRLQMDKKEELHRIPTRKLLASIKKDLKPALRAVRAAGKPKSK
jgi:hypothetical protein